MTNQPVIECVKCLSLQVDGTWYTRRKAPAHTPVYKSGVCDKCKIIINNVKAVKNGNGKTSRV
jgi:hypothetical protein